MSNTPQPVPAAGVALALYYCRMASQAPTRAVALLALQDAAEHLAKALVAGGHAPGTTVQAASALHATLAGLPGKVCTPLTQLAAVAEAGAAIRPLAKLPALGPYDDLPAVPARKAKAK